MRDPPSGRVPEQGPDWFLVATEACGGGTPDISSYLMFLGYMGIYRQKKSVGGDSRDPGGRGRALHPREPLVPHDVLLPPIYLHIP